MILDFGNGFVLWTVGDKIVASGPKTCFVIDKKTKTCEAVVPSEKTCCKALSCYGCLEPGMHVTKGGGLHSIMCIEHAMTFGFFPLTPAQLKRELDSAGILCTNVF